MGELSLSNTYDMKEGLPTAFQQYIHQSRYARWRGDLGRRETWDETVDRYMVFMLEHLYINHEYKMPFSLFDELRNAILNLHVMPSMRAMMTAGPALRRDNMAGYNCSYLPFQDLRSFSEALYILMCGTGMGFSAESNVVRNLPAPATFITPTSSEIVVQDSKEGWALAFREFLFNLWVGKVPNVNVSEIRPKGAPLKTFGGHASGPEPFLDLLEFTEKKVRDAKGQKLSPVDVHDIACKIGEIVVVGGVRRSALISLTDLNDDEMRDAKSGEWWKENPQRALANNSAVYHTTPDYETFQREWTALSLSGSGERGIFNREACVKKVLENCRRDASWRFGTNPCSEIILRPFGLCNLTEVVAREDDTDDTLAEKTRLATILGTFQSTLTNFNKDVLRQDWSLNAQEERLLGVSITGIMDNPLLNGSDPGLGQRLGALRNKAVDTNDVMAEAVGIEQSAAITCVKPSGTVSQLVQSSSGIHPAYAHQYIRRVRGEKMHPVTQFMVDQGFDHEQDVMNPNNWVFSFALSAPDAAVTRHEVSAIDQLELWLTYYRHWCEHKPSITVYVRDDEWQKVGDYVYAHFDELSGVSFLPYDGGTYQQAPYEEVDSDRWMEVKSAMPASVDWRELSRFEHEDNTTGSQELACSSGLCEIVDVT